MQARPPSSNGECEILLVYFRNVDSFSGARLKTGERKTDVVDDRYSAMR